MLDAAGLEALYDNLKSPRVVRMPTAANKEEIPQTVCAFANDLPCGNQPGVLFIGVQENGHCAHFPITGELLLSLADISHDGTMRPYPEFSIEQVQIRNCVVVAVTVYPSADLPVRYNGKVWVRVGRRTTIATIEQEDLISRQRREQPYPYDGRRVTAASLAGLDLDFFQSAFAPNNGPIEHELQSRHFLRRESPQPTVTGVLTLGKSPRNFIGSAYTHFQRIAGATLADPVQDDHELEGHILQICQQADALFRLHQPSAVSPPEYPLAAIQHLYRNAILHRDYQYFLAPIRIRWFDDRIEIHSPGGPFGHVNHRNFGAAGTISYRNPHLASSMKTLGLTQNSGLGIETARALLKENGNPELEFQVGESHVTAILRKAEL